MREEETIPEEYAEWLSNETDDGNDAADMPTLSDELSNGLSGEHEQMLEAELYQGEHPTERDAYGSDDAAPVLLHSEMLKTAIGRIENAARTQADFRNVVVQWNKLEANEARHLRNHELLRGDVPLEYGMMMDGGIFPADYTQPRWRQILRGYFLDVIHDCPFELDELTADMTISQVLREMKDEHKIIFYWHCIRELSCAEIGEMRGQSDRNICKTRAVLIRKLRKRLFKAWQKAAQNGCHLTRRQQAFMKITDSSTLTITETVIK